MKELVIFVMYICASISDMRNRTIPNRIPFLLTVLWPIWLITNKDQIGLLIRSLWSEIFVISVLITVSIVTKFIGHMSSLGGGDIKLILSTCLYLEIKETFVFLFSANFLGVMFSLLFFILRKFLRREDRNKDEITSSSSLLMYTFPFAPFLGFGVALALFLR